MRLRFSYLLTSHGMLFRGGQSREQGFLLAQVLIPPLSIKLFLLVFISMSSQLLALLLSSVFSFSALSLLLPSPDDFTQLKGVSLTANHASEVSSRVKHYILPQTVLFFALRFHQSHVALKSKRLVDGTEALQHRGNVTTFP